MFTPGTEASKHLYFHLPRPSKQGTHLSGMPHMLNIPLCTVAQLKLQQFFQKIYVLTRSSNILFCNTGFKQFML